MATERSEDRPDSPSRQGGKYFPSPTNVVSLLDLSEIEAEWGITEYRVYRAAAEGRLRAYGRPGHQKYYSRAELVQVFGEPGDRTQPPHLKRLGKSADVSGR